MTVTVPLGRKFTLLFLALLGVGLAVSYANSFGIGFYFDDIYGIANNPAIRSLRNIPLFFSDPFTLTAVRENVDIRPVLVVTFAVNYAISGNEPWSYHLFNLILHFIATGLVFVIVRDHLWWPASDRGPSGEARIPAAAAALFFALAPLNSQTLNYMWARSALLCTAFYLAAFLALLHRRWMLGSVLHVLALLTKAIAVTLPVMIVVQDFLYRDRARYPTVMSYIRDWRRLVLPVGLPAVLNVVYLVHHSILLPEGWEAKLHERWVTPWIWFMSQWPALLYYVRLFLWPDALSVDHDFPYTTSLLLPRAWLSLLVLLTWSVLALRAARRYPQVTFATLWFLITLAPESSFAALAEVINDHRPYIASSLGLSVLLAWLLDRAAALMASRARRTAFAGACLFLCIPAVTFTHYRSWQWNDSLRLWEDTVQKGPNNGRAWMNTGLIYLGRGDLISARRYFERARDISPQYAFVHMNLSVLEANEGHPDKALSEAQEAVRLRPDLSLSHFYLGEALQQKGRTSEAAAAYQQAIQLDPRYNEARAALARLGKVDTQGESAMMSAGLYALYNRRDPNAAIVQFRKVLDKNPNHYGATFQLAKALDQAGKPNDARPVWEQVLKMAEENKDKDTANTARARLAKPAVASTEFSQEETMKKGLDLLYARKNPNAAAAEFRKVLERNPNHYGATFQLAAALDQAGKKAEARPIWEKMLKLAEATNDKETLNRVRGRLARQ
jgi:tetratricopeptide (TPR) repeat protein